MKCISLWQPWATLIVLGKKQFETRSWWTPHRGPLLIHASRRWTRDEARLVREEPFRSALGADAGLELGYILGYVRLCECWRTSEKDMYSRTSRRPLPDGNEREFGDYYPGRYAWELQQVRRFAEPVKWRGMQGLFDVPAEAVAEQVAAAEGSA